MASMTCPSFSSRLTIDLNAVRQNYAQLARRVAPAECGAVVKANAYGLGALAVGAALRREGCKTFFTAHLSEALDLAPALAPDCRIFILNGLDPDCEQFCAERGFLPVLNTLDQVERWRALAIRCQRRLPAALQVDTGMSRLGLALHQVERLSRTTKLKDLDLQLVMTHLACADTPDRAENGVQLDRFRRICLLFPGIRRSIANSGGSLLSAAFHMDLARCGVALFGAPPSTQPVTLRPVVKLDARVIQLRAIETGSGIGYGLDHVATAPMRIATIGIGYADGVPRRFAATGAAWYRTHRLPVVGRISMDSLALDVTHLPDDLLFEGAFVELIGPHQPLESLADATDTIAYEILTGLGRRHQRVYLEQNRTEIYCPGALS
ncbi:MAG: alanine racemase [Pseudomonadota bacterium]